MAIKTTRIKAPQAPELRTYNISDQVDGTKTTFTLPFTVNNQQNIDYLLFDGKMLRNDSHRTYYTISHDGNTLTTKFTAPVGSVLQFVSTDNSAGAESATKRDVEEAKEAAVEESKEYTDEKVSAEEEARETKDEELSAAISVEETERAEADAALSTRIDDNDESISNLEGSVSELDNKLTEEANTRAEQDGILGQSITDEAEAREASDVAIDNKLDKNVVTDISLDSTTSTTVVKLNETKTNLKTGAITPEEVVFPVADESQAGVMNSSTYQSVTNNTNNISSLLNGTVLTDDLGENPTQEQILDAWKASSGLTEPKNSASVWDNVKHKKYTYFAAQGQWVLTQDGLGGEGVVVNQWTNESAGIAKGSTNDGQIYAEDDGTGSVNGWDQLRSDATVALDTVAGKQDALVSGTNIKTINGSSLLGSGNLVVNSLPTTSSSGRILRTGTNGVPSWSNGMRDQSSIQYGKPYTSFDDLWNYGASSHNVYGNGWTNSPLGSGQTSQRWFLIQGNNNKVEDSGECYQIAIECTTNYGWLRTRNSSGVWTDWVRIDNSYIGEISDLTTTDKTDIVSAINELNSKKIEAKDPVETEEIESVVTTSMIKDGAVTAEKIDPGVLSEAGQIPMHSASYIQEDPVNEAYAIQLDGVSLNDIKKRTPFIVQAYCSISPSTAHKDWGVYLVDTRTNTKVDLYAPAGASAYPDYKPLKFRAIYKDNDDTTLQIMKDDYGNFVVTSVPYIPEAYVTSDNIDWTNMARTLGFRYIGQFKTTSSKVISFTDPLGIGSTQYIITLSKGAGDGTGCGVWFLRERAADYGNRALLIAQRTAGATLTLTTTESDNTLTLSFGGDTSYSNVHIFAIRSY